MACTKGCSICQWWARESYQDEPHHPGCPNHPGPFAVALEPSTAKLWYRFAVRENAAKLAEYLSEKQGKIVSVALINGS